MPAAAVAVAASAPEVQAAAVAASARPKALLWAWLSELPRLIVLHLLLAAFSTAEGTPILKERSSAALPGSLELLSLPSSKLLSLPWT